MPNMFSADFEELILLTFQNSGIITQTECHKCKLTKSFSGPKFRFIPTCLIFKSRKQLDNQPPFPECHILCEVC